MTLSMKALTQARNRNPPQRRCPPNGQGGSFQTWRRTPRAVTAAPHRITHVPPPTPLPRWYQTDALVGGDVDWDSGNAAALSTDGNTLIVGSPGVASNTGQIDMYQRSGTSWVPKGIPNSETGSAPNEFVGSVVAVSGDGTVVAFGSPADTSNQGLVNTFQFTGGGWAPYGTGIAGGANYQTGYSVALSYDGTVMIIGSPGQTGSEGNATKYEFTAGNWNVADSQAGYSNSYTGSSVAVAGDGTQWCFGAPGPEPSGFGNESVTIIDPVLGYVTQLTPIVAGRFGGAVAMSDDGTTVAVGAPVATMNGKSGAGYVRVYRDNNPGAEPDWQQLGDLIVGTSIDANCGAFVQLSANGNTLGVGCVRSTSSVTNGNGVVYDLINGAWTQRGTKIATLNFPGTLALSAFAMTGDGNTVALGQDTYSASTGVVVTFAYYSVQPPPVERHDHHRHRPNRLELACNRDCWRRDDHCYLNGDTTVYIKDTCTNSAIMTKCGLPAEGLNIPGVVQRETDTVVQYPGLRLNRSASAFLLQPRPAVRGGNTLRAANTARDTRQLLQLQGIEYSRGNRCCDASRTVALQASKSAAAATKTNCQPGHAPYHRTGGMPAGTFTFRQRDATQRNPFGSSKCCPVQTLCEGSNWAQVGDDITRGVIDDNFGLTVAMSGNGKRVAGMTEGGIAQAYELQGGQWVPLGQEIDIGGEFGSLAFNKTGTRLAIGGPYYDGAFTDMGLVRVFDYNRSTHLWVQVGQDLLGQFTSDRFGYSVSLNVRGNRVAIGAIGTFTVTGRAAIHELGLTTPNVWGQLGADITGGSLDDRTGYSISLDKTGKRVVVGEQGVNSTRGQLRIFEYNSNTNAWTQLGSSITTTSFDQFGVGSSMAENGKMVAGSGPQYPPDTGVVRVYRWINGDWEQLGTDITSTDPTYQLGWNVSLSSTCNRVAASTGPALLNTPGLATVHQYSAREEDWEVLGESIVGGGVDNLGVWVGLSARGDRWIAGAPSALASGEAGQMRVYKLR
jgi:hypothetical protein